MEKKRIEIISDNFYPVLGGGSFDILTVHSKLAVRGWDIYVHSSNNTYSEKNVLKDTDEVNNIKIRRYTNRIYGFFPKIDWKNTNYIILNNFNIFPHFYILLWSRVLKLFGRKTFTIVLVPYTGYTPIWSAFSKPAAFIKKLYHQTLGLYFVNTVVDGIRAISDWEVNLLLEAKVKTRIEVIKCGLEDQAFGNIEADASANIKDLVSKTGPYMVQIGRVHKLKNYEASIRALTKVDGIKLIIIGPDHGKEYKNFLLSLIKELKLQDRVIFAGVVPIMDKFYLLKKSVLAIHTSLYEGFGIAVYEAMSQGCVCLVSNNTAVDDLIQEGINGYRVAPHDYETFAKRIKYVLDNRNSPEINKISENNIKATRNASWDVIAKQVEDFYISLKNI